LFYCQFGAAAEEAEFLALPDPLAMHFPTGFDADHAVAGFASQALVLAFECGSQPISAYYCFGIAFALSAVGAYAACGFADFDEVVLAALGGCAHAGAEFAEVHVLVHLFVFAAGEAEVVVEAVAGGVELVAEVAGFVVGVEIGEGDAFGDGGHFGEELEFG
jgi:hypothetical protein